LRSMRKVWNTGFTDTADTNEGGKFPGVKKKSGVDSVCSN